MQGNITDWGKEVKKGLIERGWSINDLAERIGKSRTRVSGVVNGRIYSDSIASAISAWTWKYITDNAINDDVLWPEATNASGSGVGVGAGFYCGPAASGVRAAWCFGNLNFGGSAGVPCRRSDYGVSDASWGGSLGAPGLEG